MQFIVSHATSIGSISNLYYAGKTCKLSANHNRSIQLMSHDSSLSAAHHAISVQDTANCVGHEQGTTFDSLAP